MGRITTLDELDPGIVPCEFRILIAPEEIEEKTKGGIILPDTKKEVDQIAAMRGRLVAVAPLAGSSIWPEGEGRPKLGDAVYFAKYAGILVEGRDGREYRLAHDKDLSAVIEEPTNG